MLRRSRRVLIFLQTPSSAIIAISILVKAGFFILASVYAVAGESMRTRVSKVESLVYEL